jgi:hypothetical protein
MFRLVRTNLKIIAMLPSIDKYIGLGFSIKREIEKLDLTKLCLPKNERPVKIDRFHFQVSSSQKKSPNLGNGRGKTKVRTEAVPFPKPKYGKKSRFRFWK